MFGDITRFLLDTLFTLFGAALLLRAWTQAVRLSRAIRCRSPSSS